MPRQIRKSARAIRAEKFCDDIHEYIKANPNARNRDIVAAMDISACNASTYLKRLILDGRIFKSGVGHAGYYDISLLGKVHEQDGSTQIDSSGYFKEDRDRPKLFWGHRDFEEVANTTGIRSAIKMFFANGEGVADAI